MNASDGPAAKKANINTNANPAAERLDTSGPCFMKLLSECGVILPSAPTGSDPQSKDTAAPEPYCISVSPNTLRSSVASLLKELQALPSVNLQTIVLDDMEAVLQNESTLHSMLLPMKQVVAASSSSSSSSSSSLIKVLLRQPFLQSPLLTLLLEALPSIDTSAFPNTSPSAAIPKLILTSVRWLDTIYDPATLTATTLEIITVCEKALQLDLISILPDIIPDSAADKAVEKLMELKEVRIVQFLRVIESGICVLDDEIQNNITWISDYGDFHVQTS